MRLRPSTINPTLGKGLDPFQNQLEPVQWDPLWEFLNLQTYVLKPEKLQAKSGSRLLYFPVSIMKYWKLKNIYISYKDISYKI